MPSLTNSLSVFQTKIWISTHFGGLAVGGIKTDFQNGRVTDPSQRNTFARLPQSPMGGSRLVKAGT